MLKSGGRAAEERSGNSRRPSNDDTKIVTITSGRPTIANSKKAKPAPPASRLASETMTLTGLPLKVSNAPALAAYASGIRLREGDSSSRRLSATATGSNAATAPFGLINALTPALRASTIVMSRVRDLPCLLVRAWPTHAVTPVASSPSLTTNRVAMKITTGSPNPASTVSASSTPVTYSAIAVRIATTPTESRFQTNNATDPATINNVRLASVISGARGISPRRRRPRGWRR